MIERDFTRHDARCKQGGAESLNSFANIQRLQIFYLLCPVKRKLVGRVKAARRELER